MLFTAATVMAAADVASAQPAAPQEAPASAGANASAGDAVTRADAFFRQGLRLYSDKKYVEAEKELESAWELNPTFDVAYNLGNTKYQLKKHREAAQHLSFALRNWPLVKTVAKLKPTAEQRFAESRAQVGAVAVTVGVAGAEVLVDGKPVGRAPLEGEVFVEPGEHQVEARQVGYAPASQTVTVAKGATAAVTLALAAAKSEGATAAGTTEGGGSAVGAGAGGPVMGQPPAAPVEPPPKKNWVPVIALGAASAVGLAVGITSTVLSRNARSDAEGYREQIRQANRGCIDPPSDLNDTCRDVESEAERAARFGTVSVIGYAASGALAVAAVTYALWPRRAAPAAHGVRVLPVTNVGGGGVVVVGAW
ncbi:PEGA domain-containing protein [Sorangium sp. So ce375]|uniref:PEGA domain-containing protein n=1 Tax=Sorangium sp. So ce375 TaxID=3133306 RepID=UPI003F5C7CA8